MTRLAVLAGCVLVLAGCSDSGAPSAPTTAGGSAAGGTPHAAGAGSQLGGGAGQTSQGGSALAGAAGQAGAGEGGSQSSLAGAAGAAGSAGANGGGGGSAGGSGGVINEPGPASQVAFDWGKAVIDTRLATTPNFTTAYQDGLALRGIYLAYQRLKDAKYLQALTKAADSYPAPPGNDLDEMMHMSAVVDAFEATKKESYRAPATTTRGRYDTYPTSDGVFWHGQTDRPHQLWADGTFMSIAFLTRYASVFNDQTVWPIAATQLVNTQKHLKNPATGLLWHAWDESGVVAWSKHPSNTNEIHWGRAMGWFAIASILTLEALPPGDAGRAPVEAGLKDLLTSLAKYQDPTTGRWYQVVDQTKDSRNWLETSCSSMFSYASWWAYKHRIVDASFADIAKKGLAGVLQKVKKDANNRTTIETTCQGLSATDDLVGTYFNHGRADNDPHGIGTFILMWEGMQ